MIEVFIDDYGYNLEIGTGFDLTDATTLEVEAKPYLGGTTATITCTADNTTDILAPITQGFFDRAGLWEFNAKITFASSVRHGETFRVLVKENI